MANFLLSPNMVLPVPTVGIDPGPDWANNINAALLIVDSHTHESGSGVQITPGAININSDLSWNNTNNINAVRAVRLYQNASTISASGSDQGCIYSYGNELYYNDRANHVVQITTNGQVNGAPGNITGLSSPASAFYTGLSGTFSFQQQASTAANLDVGSIAIRYPGSYPTPSGNFIQLQAPSSLASGYSLTLPAKPASQKIMTLDNNGIISAPYGVDNSTIEISSDTIQVKDGGISTAKIADGAVTNAKLSAFNYTQTRIIISGTYLTTLNGGYYASATITKGSRPIAYGFSSDSGYSGGNSQITGLVYAGDSPIVDITIYRDTTPVFSNQLILQCQTSGAAIGAWSIPPSIVNGIDFNASPGTHTYKVYLSMEVPGTRAVFDGVFFYVYET